MEVDNPNKFRVFVTSSGKVVFGGRSAENNEKLVEQVEPTETVLHTVAPGSPFTNIKGKSTKKDICEAAVFCAKYSQDWRDNKKDILIHVFRGAEIYKEKTMKLGTYSVKKFDKLKVKKTDILKFEEELENETD
jgi:predicted ribosome quality control (RQC) complex YloA/Tae2 family protein